MIGTTVAHYKITDKLGEGGMGEVYRAHDSQLGREVAVKVLPELFVQDEERLARFEREARTLAALDHANIAAIYGLEEVDGKRFLIMQLAEGETLQERIAKGPLATQDALKIARQIAEALESAHAKGIIHRDLKPANVKVDSKGQVKVLDFGLAKAIEGDPTTSGSQPSLMESPTLTAQMTGAALMVSASFTFLIQVTVMQRVKLRPTQFVRIGLVSLMCGAAIIASFTTFAVLAVGMAFLGAGLGLCMPAISAGASLAVEPEEQGAAAGLVSSCPAIGFVVGPICAGALYQVHGPLAPLFSTAVFFLVLVGLVLSRR